LVIALASNDALSANLKNIGELLTRKQVFFVPMRQDDPVNKPHSLVADFSRIPECVAAALEGNYWTEVSYEAILAYNPDVIVIPSGADYTVADICNDAQLSALEAVKNGAVYAMPGSIEEWDSPIPSGILGAMWLASVLHSDKYTPDTFAKDAVGFYETFYGFTPDSALLK
jgi:hypothetical protein